jgi:pyruvate dehydrogenase E2 component (dihydrolipoamide acetyltransferase)
MAIEIKIPRLGWSMEEGVFSGWLKKNGDLVRNGEPLFTLESEKNAQDIESTDAGTLRIPEDSPQPGDTVKVGQVIGHLVVEDGVVPPEAKPVMVPSTDKEIQQEVLRKIDLRVSSDGTPAPSASMAVTDGIPASSPRARRRATELGVEVALLQGSGNKGRIIEADVLKAAANRDDSVMAATETKTAPTVVGKASTMRRNIAERTAFSFSHIPHFYVRAEVDATELIALREHLVGILERECGIRITLTDFLLRAQALALREFPAANAVWQNGGLVNQTDSDVGLVVGLPDGLVIPVIRAAQKLSFVELAKERARLVQAVKAGRFDAETVSGGATSLSNLGTTRADEFAAIIAPHQSSMLAVGRAAPRPYVVDGRVEIRTTLRLCLSADHRVLDGGPAAGFLGKIVELLENPKTLVDGA